MKAFLAFAALSVATVSACPQLEWPSCGPEEQMCPGGFDSNGCDLPWVCTPIDNGMDYVGNACPSICRKTSQHCMGDNFQICDDGLDPYTGCQMAGECVEMFEANQCPKNCPVRCGPEEQECAGGQDSNGCEIAAKCVPMYSTSNMDQYGSPCYQPCPAACDGDVCPGPLDSYGCPTADYCVDFGADC